MDDEAQGGCVDRRRIFTLAFVTAGTGCEPAWGVVIG